jgi:hypothetical protein
MMNNTNTSLKKCPLCGNLRIPAKRAFGVFHKRWRSKKNPSALFELKDAATLIIINEKN